jgi:hypothetical protein
MRMSLLRNSIVHLGSWTALAGFGYGPITIRLRAGHWPDRGIVGIATNFEDFRLVSRNRRKLTREKKIELRDKWGAIFKAFS